MCKRCPNIFITLKKVLLGCFRIEGERDKDTEIGLKEERVIKIKTTVLYSRCSLLLLRFCIYSPLPLDLPAGFTIQTFLDSVPAKAD